VTRLAWGLILSIALVAPELAAKAAKRPKGSESPKSSKEPSGAVVFTLARPENAGIMNSVPSRIVLEPKDGILSSRLTHLGQVPKSPRKEGGLVLVGGDAIEMTVKPGTYSVRALTPVEAQPPGGYPPGRKARVWESAVVKVMLAKGEAITLVVEPGVTGADYNGSWLIAKAAPPEAEPPAEGDTAAAPAQQ
jgi:hypothetical protein